jgi:hypothetical protein
MPPSVIRRSARSESSNNFSAFRDLDKEDVKEKELLREGTQVMGNEGEKKLGKWGEEQERRLPPCTLAVEWAEHARFYREDEPCDDGRAGRACGNRKGEEPCPI